jgi:hypothetical protein
MIESARALFLVNDLTLTRLPRMLSREQYFSPKHSGDCIAFWLWYSPV